MRRLGVLAIVLLLAATPVLGYFERGEDSPYQAIAQYHSPIIFIPGIMGSTLVDNAGWETWPGYLQMDRSALRLNDDGKTQFNKGSKITPTVPIRSKYGSGIYKSFYEYMDKGPYTFRGKSGKFGWMGKAYFDHAYDFRLDNNVQVDGPGVEKTLKEDIDEILKKTHSDKIIILAHSMGGYQARMFAAKYPDKVKAVVFLSSPHHGAPKVFEALTEGYNFGVNPALVTNYQVWGFARNWPGAYELMYDTPTVQGPDGAWSFEQMYQGDWISYQGLEHARDETGIMTAVTTAADAKAKVEKELRKGLNSQTVVKLASAFRQKYNGITIPAGIKVFNINGDNKVTVVGHTARFEDATTTYLSGYSQAGRTRVPTYSQVALPYKVLRLTAKTEPKGDGTVSNDGLQWSGAEKTWTVTAEHGDVPGAPETGPLLTQIFEDINHDKRDKEYVDRLVTIADGELVKITDVSGRQEAAETLAGMIKEEKKKEDMDVRKLKKYEGDLKARSTYIALNSIFSGRLKRINVVIPGEGKYDEKNPDFKAWIVVEEFRVVASGIGEVQPTDASVIIKDMGTFNSLGGIGVGRAYKDGLIEVDAGFVTNTLAKVASIVSGFLGGAE